jgi:hypothetical protein
MAMTVCPRCGKVIVDFDTPRTDAPTCNPIRSPECWKVIGKSKNGSPILHVIDGGA